MISYAAKSSATQTNGSGLNQPYVGGIAAGDLLIMQAISINAPPGGAGTVGVIIAPAGWDVVGMGTFKDVTTQDIGAYLVCCRTATGSESGTVAINRTGSDSGGGNSTVFMSQMYRFDGGMPSKYGQSLKNNGDGNSTTTWTGVGGPTGRTDIALIGQVGNTDPGVPFGFTTDATDVSVGASPNVYLECSSLEGATGAVDVSGAFGSSDGWATVLVVFTEAAGSFFIHDH